MKNPKKKLEKMTSQNAIQIVKPVNHAFQLDPQTLTKILGAADIKNRYAVVISIAGALRKGKSFLLNFILKYLYAQVLKSLCSLLLHIFLGAFESPKS